MLIFNTTYLVSDKVYGKWLKWVSEIHIPFMVQDEVFTKPQVAKVLSAHSDQEGTSFSVQFHVQDMRVLEDWHHANAQGFQQQCADMFGEEVVFFTTVLELVN